MEANAEILIQAAKREELLSRSKGSLRGSLLRYKACCLYDQIICTNSSHAMEEQTEGLPENNQHTTPPTSSSQFNIITEISTNASIP
jgi:hypothetical protein